MYIYIHKVPNNMCKIFIYIYIYLYTYFFILIKFVDPVTSNVCV